MEKILEDEEFLQLKSPYVLGACNNPGYAYSSALEKKDGTWTLDDLNEWLYSPRDFVLGTKMSFVGIKDDKERTDLIAYMMKQSDSPMLLLAIKEVAPQESKKEGS